VGYNDKTKKEECRVGKAYTIRWDTGMTRLRRRSTEWAKHTQSGGI
jgi:hypothetical protein